MRLNSARATTSSKSGGDIHKEQREKMQQHHHRVFLRKNFLGRDESKDKTRDKKPSAMSMSREEQTCVLRQRDGKVRNVPFNQIMQNPLEIDLVENPSIIRNNFLLHNDMQFSESNHQDDQYHNQLIEQES